VHARPVGEVPAAGEDVQLVVQAFRREELPTRRPTAGAGDVRDRDGWGFLSSPERSETLPSCVLGEKSIDLRRRRRRPCRILGAS